jgi:hypothetical protein
LNEDQIRSSFTKSTEIFSVEEKFSIWEKQIFRKIKNAEISFSQKFRKFVIFLDEKKEYYIPDILLGGFEYNQKEVIIEAHKKISETDIKKYRRFRSTFGSSYYLIMIVPDNEVMIWKKRHKQKDGGIFNEIYAESNLEDLIKNLKKWKEDYDDIISKYGQTALCPPPPKGHGCGIIAKGFEEIKEIFGYRGKRVQSLCRECRKEHAKKQKEKLKRIMNDEHN